MKHSSQKPLPLSVLVVDDEFSIRRSLEKFLEDLDFEVSAVASAEEALALLEKQTFHAAIIDLRLPGMNGETLILKSHEMMPGMRFLIHTGCNSYRIPPELKKIGIQSKHLFFKPLPDLNVVKEALEDIVTRNAKVKP